MADRLSITPSLDVSWNYNEAVGDDVGGPSDSSNLSYSETLEDGTGASQADVSWRVQTTIATAGSDLYDMNALAVTVFGEALSLSMDGLKGIYCEVIDTTSGYVIYLANSGGAITNGHAAAFHSGTAAIPINAGSALHMVNKMGTWDSSAGTNEIRIYNNCGSTVEYILALWGTTA